MTDKIFGIHAQALHLRARRAQILAANLANADTPGYRAKDLDVESGFAHVLRNSAATLSRTHSGHIQAGSVAGGETGIKYRVSSQPSLDGNTIDMEQERSAFMQNAMMYEASLRFINGRISGLLTAIRGE